MNLDGSNVTRLTDTGADFSPAWSPDGKKIAFCSMRDSDPDDYADVELYLMNADGSGQKALTDTQAGETDPVWSPDGKGILISTGNGGNNSLVVIDPSSGQIIRQLPKGLGGMYQPDWQILRDEPSLASTAASPAGPSLLFFTGGNGCEIRQASGGQQNLIAIEAGKNGKKSVLAENAPNMDMTSSFVPIPPNAALLRHPLPQGRGKRTRNFGVCGGVRHRIHQISCTCQSG